MSAENSTIVERKEIPRILRIGVDLDDTVVDYGALYFRAIKIGLGINLLAKYQSFKGRIRNLPEITALPNGQAFLRELIRRDFPYRYAKPIVGAIETLNHWRNQGHEIWFLSARAKPVEEVTKQWLIKYNLGWAIGRTFLTENWDDDGGTFKDDLCRQLELNVLIDDRIQTLRRIIAPTVKTKIGLQKPWNIADYDENKDDFILVPDWSQISEIIDIFSSF